ncbi:MAG: tetratricopeptide repeat protein [Deltaproteobacteria bacterium]|nr:tetratricopeptide repeat protein [Deltaproteobacteria bacterium]
MRRVLLASLVLTACGPKGPVDHPVDPLKPVDRVVMEPIVIKAWKEGGVIKSEAYDAALLFDEAYLRYEEGGYEDALGIYERILEEFPDTVLAPASMFNMALCHEKMGLVAEAAGIYDTLVGLYPGSSAVPDAMFRRGYCLEGLEQWPEAIEQYEDILAMTDLSGPDTVEAMSRIGTILLDAGDVPEAEQALRAAVQYFVEQSQIERFVNTFYVARAQFHLAEIYRREFEAVTFTVDEAQIREALETKLIHMVEARDAYVQTIKLGNYHWAAASGYEVGQLFRTFHDQIMTAPLPPELSTDELVEMYYGMLKEKVEPLLESAVSVWEMTLLMAERVGVGGEWVDKTEQALSSTRALLAQSLVDEEPVTEELLGPGE